MWRGAICLLGMLAGAAPATAAEVAQSTAGPCSPIQSGNNNVVNCPGVPQRAVDRLNELLDRKDLDLKQKTAEANEWARRYNELNTQLEETKKQLAAKGEDAALVQTAQDLLHEGKLEEARAIFAAVDLTSIQTQFDPRTQKQQDATELLAKKLNDLPRAIRIEIVPGSIKAGLSDVDPSMAILNGKLSITFDTRGLKRVFDMFNTYTDVQSPSGPSKFGSVPPRRAFVCLSNLLGQITACRGEQINFARVGTQFHHMYIKGSLRSGNEELGSTRALVNFNCGGYEQRFRWEPAYFEATSYYDPNSLEFKPNPEWGYLDDASRDEYVGADFEHSSIDELNWAKKNRETRLVTLRITDVPVEAGTTEETRAAELRARMPAQSVCSFYDQQQGWRLLINSGSAPITRYFYIVAPKESLSQVDKIGFSAEAE